MCGQRQQRGLDKIGILITLRLGYKDIKLFKIWNWSGRRIISKILECIITLFSTSIEH